MQMEECQEVLQDASANPMDLHHSLQHMTISNCVVNVYGGGSGAMQGGSGAMQGGSGGVQASPAPRSTPRGRGRDARAPWWNVKGAEWGNKHAKESATWKAMHARMPSSEPSSGSDSWDSSVDLMDVAPQIGSEQVSEPAPEGVVTPPGSVAVKGKERVSKPLPVHPRSASLSKRKVAEAELASPSPARPHSRSRKSVHQSLNEEALVGETV